MFLESEKHFLNMKRNLYLDRPRHTRFDFPEKEGVLSTKEGDYLDYDPFPLVCPFCEKETYLYFDEIDIRIYETRCINCGEVLCFEERPIEWLGDFWIRYNRIVRG